MFAERETVTAPASASKQPATTLSQAKANKFKDALAAKKSVRALFASKTKIKSKPQFNSKSKLTPQKRLFVLGSAAALATVVIIGGWLVLSMMSGTGNQYVIPPLSDNLPLGAPITLPATEVAATDTTSTPTSIADSVAPPATVAADTAAQNTTVMAETVAATDTPTQAETVAATETTTLSESAAKVESATTIAETSASAPVASPSAPATTAPVVAQATPTLDPETGLYELPLDTGQSGAGSVTEGSQAPIRISRSEPMRNPDMQMLTAWSAYQQGDYAAARILYQQLLARDPDNRDALLGVAASAMQQGDMVSARQTYNRLLNLNPRDALARTGLLETTTASDPVQRETDLKALQTDHPEIAAVSYSLGNLYASQQRWHDAQQAYYEALLSARTQAEGPVSPDYAFNLAISLERINQPEAALNFYREALALSVQHVPGFDMTILDQRLRALERSQP
jgi:Tfp pilus assembly protein PilF